MRLVQASQPVNSMQQLVRHTSDDLDVFAVHIGVESAKIGYAGSCPHAAQKAVAFDEKNFVARAPRHCRGNESSRPSTQHDHVVFAENRRLSLRLGNKRSHFLPSSSLDISREPTEPQPGKKGLAVATVFVNRK